MFSMVILEDFFMFRLVYKKIFLYKESFLIIFFLCKENFYVILFLCKESFCFRM